MRRRDYSIITLLVLTILAGVAAFSYAKDDPPSFGGALSKMRRSYDGLRDYRCVFDSFSSNGSESALVKYSYYFKKPSMVRMEILSEKNKNTVLLYDGGAKVRVKPGSGVLSATSFSLEPDHSKIIDKRNNGVPQSTWGWLIERHEEWHNLIEQTGVSTETVYGRSAIVYELRSKQPETTALIATERFWVDAETHLPLKYIQYDSKGETIQSGSFYDVKINTGLKDELFKEFKKG